MSSSENPVVSTISAVAATVIRSSPNQRKAPTRRPSSRTTDTAVVSSPRTFPTAQASTTPATAATTWRAPWDNVR